MCRFHGRTVIKPPAGTRRYVARFVADEAPDWNPATFVAAERVANGFSVVNLDVEASVLLPAPCRRCGTCNAGRHREDAGHGASGAATAAARAGVPP